MDFFGDQITDNAQTNNNKNKNLGGFDLFTYSNITNCNNNNFETKNNDIFYYINQQNINIINPNQINRNNLIV